MSTSESMPESSVHKEGGRADLFQSEQAGSGELLRHRNGLMTHSIFNQQQSSAASDFIRGIPLRPQGANINSKEGLARSNFLAAQSTYAGVPLNLNGASMK